MVRITACLCIRDEEERLADCLSRLGFVDETVVVLDRSTDRSKEIAEAHGARIVEGAFEREGDRRNAAIAAATGDWCLEVDADEWVEPVLAEEIRATVASSDKDWHLIPVDNHIGGRLVRHGWGASFGKGAYAGLFRRAAKHWGPQRVHPAVTLTGTAGGMLQARLVHHVDRDISDMIRRLDRYTSARAADIREGWARGQEGRETLTRNLLRIVGRFWKCYVRRRGYKEGNWGLLIALMAALYPILSYLKARLEPVGAETSGA